jgi:hypothetical protein
MASLAGQSVQLSLGMDALEIGFSGYNDGLGNFVKKVLQST